MSNSSRTQWASRVREEKRSRESQRTRLVRRIGSPRFGQSRTFVSVSKASLIRKHNPPPTPNQREMPEHRASAFDSIPYTLYGTPGKWNQFATINGPLSFDLLHQSDRTWLSTTNEQRDVPFLRGLPVEIIRESSRVNRRWKPFLERIRDIARSYGNLILSDFCGYLEIERTEEKEDIERSNLSPVL